MLYNPHWRDPDPMTLHKLIAWLERQPADQRYDYFCHGECLLANYVRSCGYPSAWIGGFTWRQEGQTSAEILMPGKMQIIAAAWPHTYGSVLTRARAALSEKQSALPNG